MATRSKIAAQLPSTELKGWQKIAEFLGQPVSVAQRWAKTGMPIAHQGRAVVADPNELNKWLGRESGEPVHVATDQMDLSVELKRALSHVKQEKISPAAADKSPKKKRRAA